jgi:Kef-type K+ transport system membrane component KefB
VNITQAIPTLVLIAVAAVLAPIIAEQSRSLRVPSVVIELGLGILLGPYVFDLAHPGSLVTALADMGLSFLMFMAGFELDLARLRGRPLTLGALGWAISLGLALGFGFALVSSGLALDTVIVGLALTTTALGTLVPAANDAGVLETRFGAYLLGIGTAGEFGPIVAVSVLFSKKDPVLVSLLLVAFVAIAALTTLLVARSHPPKVVALLRRHLHTSSQLPVRVAVLLVLLLVYLAFKLGLDVLLGAFSAGIVVRQLAVGEDSGEIESKLSAIGFGFLVPIFFIVSGIDFDLHLLKTATALFHLALFFVLFLVVRGAPIPLLYRRDLARGERWPMVFFSATGLPLIVVITSIGTAEGRMRPVNAAALVGAGVASVLIFPAAGLRRLRAAGIATPVIDAASAAPVASTSDGPANPAVASAGEPGDDPPPDDPGPGPPPEDPGDGD